ncbi:MAG: AMP-binding protein [Acidimicrobiia bacterium]|nr:AMP-binding protein [Acidimicrobiia bacterium]
MQRWWRERGAWTDESLVDRLLAAPARFGADRVAVVDGGVRLTLGGLVERSGRVAAALHARGVRPGDVVAYQLPNWWESVVLAWGILRLGAVASPVTPTLREREVGFVLRCTGARIMVVPERFRGHDHVATVAATGFDGEVLVARGASGPASFDALLREGEPPTVTVRADDPAVVLWTSGTTSDPKGVVHSHQGLRHEADSLVAGHDLRADDRLLLPMPATHVAGLTYGVLLPPCVGVPAVLMDVWDPGEGLALLAAERITVMISTPVFLRGMVDHPRFAATDVSSLRLFSLGGAGVAPSMVREGGEAFGCWCKRTYGSTEYPTLTTGRVGDDPELDATTDGRLIGEAELRIVDPATGRDVAEGEPGEIWARGPEMAWGYLDPSLDAEAFVDGWFRTGDLATFRDGHLRVIDRLKDIIIRGGENVSAGEVESLLVAHPGVRDAAVVAVPDRLMGERVCAFVVPSGARPPTLEELAGYLATRGLARFKIPERLEVRDDLPRTASGKVQKASLREEVR